MPTTFDLMHSGGKVVTLSTQLLGAHNIENIVGISAMLLEKNLLTPNELADSVKTFEGVKRRMEYLSPHSSVAVFEGFGSSYEKAKSAMAAMKLHFPTQRLVVVFEPHTFSWRNRQALPQYDDVFLGADKVYIYEPAVQGANTHAQVSQDEIVARVAATGLNTEAIGGGPGAVKVIGDGLEQNDAVLLLTSGDLGGLIQSLPKFVTEKYPG
jgi:UDP-N-acetylmuramate: L-alanyl-gamma-D-glutamyl-meso-diaminopimelate ligase